jgi:hypothetical protein
VGAKVAGWQNRVRERYSIEVDVSPAGLKTDRLA